MTMRLVYAALAACLFLLPAASRAQAKVTLQFWVSWDPAQADAIAAKQQLAAFEKTHPDIAIAVQNITYDALHDKLITALAGGQGPDLSWGLPEWMGELNRMGALMDLSTFAKTWPARNAIYPNVIKALTVNGRLMALPHYLGIRALLYHANMLHAAGITAPPATWDELLADAAKIKKTTGKDGFGIAATGVRAPQELIAYLAQQGVSLAEPTKDHKDRNTWADHPAQMQGATRVFAFYRHLLDDGAIPPDATGWGWEEEDTNFALGRYAMVIDGPWMESREAQNPKEMADVGIAAPPAGAKAATFFEINPFYIYRATKHPKETLELAAFLTSKQYQQAVHPQNSPRMDVSTNTKWGQGFMKLAPIGVVFPPVPLGGISRDMEQAIGRVLLQNEAPERAAQTLAAAINRDLRQAGQLGAAD